MKSEQTDRQGKGQATASGGQWKTYLLFIYQGLANSSTTDNFNDGGSINIKEVLNTHI